MSKLTCNDLLKIVEFESKDFMRKAKHILRKNNWTMYSDINSKISKKLIKIFRKLNIDNVYDEKKRLFLINNIEKQVISLLFSAIVVISCYFDDISQPPYFIFKDIDYHKIFNKEKRYFMNSAEIKSYIDLFNSYYESSKIEDSLSKVFKEYDNYIDQFRELKSYLNELLNKITLKEFDDESSSFIDSLSNCRLTPTNEERLTRKMSFDSLQCDMEINSYMLQILTLFIPISPLDSGKLKKTQSFFNSPTFI